MFETDPLIDAFVARFPRLFHGQQPRAPSSLPPGWNDVVGRMLADLDALLNDTQARRFLILQIKEKFAGLRFYWRLGSEQTTVADLIGGDDVRRMSFRPKQVTPLFEQISARVRLAEQESDRTCQRCGAPDARVQRGWLVTLCGACEARPQGDAS